LFFLSLFLHKQKIWTIMNQNGNLLLPNFGILQIDYHKNYRLIRGLVS
jgi:hypothetical protein